MDYWDIMWSDSHFRDGFLKTMKPYQKINHFPRMTQLSKKNYLGLNLERMYREFPSEYDFFPKTWTFPHDKIKFMNFY